MVRYESVLLLILVAECGVWNGLQDNVRRAFANAAASSSSLKLVPLDEGFHHDVDDNTVTVGDKHACCLERVDDVDIGGEVVCWGDNSAGQTDSPAVSLLASSPSPS
jgi:hypothetical protein